MRTHPPLIPGMAAQDGASGTTETVASTVEQDATPMISGPGTALWVGFGAFVLIFVLVIWAIIRGRVIKPAQRMAEAEPTFFEPAGADAEITFEEPVAGENDTGKKKKRRSLFGRKKSKDKTEETAVPSEPVGDLHFDMPDDEDVVERDGEADAKPSFSGLFSKRREEEDHPDGEGVADAEDFSEISIQEGPADYEQADTVESALASQEREIQDAYARAETERRHAEDEAARIRAEAEAERARIDAERAATETQKHQFETERASAEREAMFERRKAEAALEQRMQSLSAMQRKLTEKADTLSSDAQAIHHRIGAELNHKFDSLSHDLHEKLGGATTQLARLSAEMSPTQSGTSDVSQLTREITALREKTESAMLRLSDRIDNLSAAQAELPGGREDLKKLNKLLAERAAPAVAGAIQLHELVRSTLPAERFRFDHVLKNGATADCMVDGPDGTGSFAIDARFPVEAFEKYASASESSRQQAETIYRRAVLRHMIYVAEKLISPGETAGFAILFLPSDTIFNDLHRNFPDIVQDSYRARIWIVSPTSLMATLHMMSAASASFSRETEPDRNSANEKFERQLEALSARINALEEEEAKPAPTTDDQASDHSQETDKYASADPVDPYAGLNEEQPEPSDQVTETGFRETEFQNAPADEAAPTRPPFPLR